MGLLRQIAGLESRFEAAEKECRDYRESIAHLTGVLEGLRYRVDDDCRKTIEEILAAYDKIKEPKP